MAFEIWNRRYTGSKYKLADWIVDIIQSNCYGRSFCDIFSGTGVVTQRMLDKMRTIIVNDFLYSNEVIYNAFFLQEKYDNRKIESYHTQFAGLVADNIEDNYISVNYGDRFFSYRDALLIGEIRERIEQATLSVKEKAILLASLLYSVDKIANTVGHYDAYIKGNKVPDKFQYELIKPYITDADIKIFRRDANELAKNIFCDIVYIDPPYNSRQYSRFYHVLENITKWEKPELFGVAIKPAPENMSAYCRSDATKTFDDLIKNLSCKYIVVSYNNTYNSKSSSSKNKMDLGDILSILERKGTVRCFEKAHPYFNAGKTNLANHKELLYLVEVRNEN